VQEGICGAVRDFKWWSRTVCAARRVMDGGGCGTTSTRGVWLGGTMVVGCRFRVCVVRGREMEQWSGARESFSKKKNVCAGV